MMEKKLEQLSNKIEELDNFVENMQKKYNFSVMKSWRNNPQIDGFSGEPVPVCQFCKELDGVEVPYGKLWTHPSIIDKSTGKPYTNLRPGPSTHKGCRCDWTIVIK